jgi:hypothetical protein
MENCASSKGVAIAIAQTRMVQMIFIFFFIFAVILFFGDAAFYWWLLLFLWLFIALDTN